MAFAVGSANSAVQRLRARRSAHDLIQNESFVEQHAPGSFRSAAGPAGRQQVAIQWRLTRGWQRHHDTPLGPFLTQQHRLIDDTVTDRELLREAAAAEARPPRLRSTSSMPPGDSWRRLTAAADQGG
eukprot:CAMPEP_0196790148 /NCGR_PEP_ID=MMETSP1104-20130614/27750_1 /TAXON_ID=33652 /ORGANISM="Cafeteria sp., Strain Caron Lab Isolate" /LENGTH=126 /DNA_ID=CAMNT_0042160513 /DNA_START=51 /DNA_END=428 /DNA_ORIENTATION=-